MKFFDFIIFDEITHVFSKSFYYVKMCFNFSLTFRFLITGQINIRLFVETIQIITLRRKLDAGKKIKLRFIRFFLIHIKFTYMTLDLDLENLCFFACALCISVYNIIFFEEGDIVVDFS